MSTRSAILMKVDGGYRGVYCHFDGYPSGVGRTLLDHYKDESKVKALIDLGSISVLAQEVAPKEGKAHSWSDRQLGVTIAYHRDRGDEMWVEQEATIRQTVANIGHNGHIYVFKDGEWRWNGRLLADVVPKHEARERKQQGG